MPQNITAEDHNPRKMQMSEEKKVEDSVGCKDSQARYMTEHIVRLYDLIAALAKRMTGEDLFVLMGDSDYNKELWRYKPDPRRVVWMPDENPPCSFDFEKMSQPVTIGRAAQVGNPHKSASAPPTKPFSETVQARAAKDPEFREGLINEAIEAIQRGEFKVAITILEDLTDKTIPCKKITWG